MADVDKKAAQIEADLKAAEKKRADDASGLSEVLAAIQALGGRIDKIEKAVPKAADSDDPNMMADDMAPTNPAQSALADEAARAQSQMRADAVATAHGMRAPPPMAGETPLAYQRRLVGQWQRLSKTFKDVNLASVSQDILTCIEKSIYADAVAASYRPEVAEGHLLERLTTDASGRQIRTFHGHPSAWMRQFQSHPMRLIGINLRPDRD